jgi:NAD(P)-dependent dehydrogenase (short-subunit alcohol dehydrogenase family)
MAVNLRAPVFLSQAFAGQLPEGASGNIINIADQRVLRPNPLFFSYTLSKSALWAATKTMAQALAPRIRVNAIGPGPALGNIYQSEEDFERERNSTLLKRGTSPEEIARAVLYILRTPAMTGQMIVLDGGQHLLWQTPDIGAT